MPPHRFLAPPLSVWVLTVLIVGFLAALGAGLWLLGINVVGLLA